VTLGCWPWTSSKRSALKNIGLDSDGETYKDIQNHHISQLLGPEHCQVIPLLLWLYHRVGSVSYSLYMHGMHGVHSRRSWTLSSPSHTKPIQPQHWLTSHAASRALDCTDVHQEVWLTVSEWSKNGHVHTWPEVTGIIPPTKYALFQHALLTAAFIWKQSLAETPVIQTTVSGAWNGASGTNDGRHIGRAWMTSAKHVYFSFTVVALSPAKEIASAPEQDPAGVHCASMKGLVQITTLNNLNQFVLTMTLIQTCFDWL